MALSFGGAWPVAGPASSDKVGALLDSNGKVAHGNGSTYFRPETVQRIGTS